MATQMPEELSEVIQSYEQKKLRQIDGRRALIRLVSTEVAGKKITQETIARHLGMTQAGVSQELRQARALPEVPEGFSGASPLEICERYAAKDIDRMQLVEELCLWTYTTRTQTDGYDSLMVDPPGSWGDVEEALHRGLIDFETYDEVLDRISKE